MSAYPEWWDSTITLYNKYTDPLTKAVTWHRRVIEGCFVDNTPHMVISDTVAALSNDVICRIRESSIFRNKAVWVNLPNDEMSGYFTLAQGDIIVMGEVNDEIDEDSRGHRATDLMSKYKDLQGCIVVKRYSENVGAGRCMPHYYVSGE